MRFLCIFLFCISVFYLPAIGQGPDIAGKALKFLSSLSESQKSKTVFPFDSEERFNFHFVPRTDWKGISINEMDSNQRELAYDLMRSGLSQDGYLKVRRTMDNEVLLKQIEHRSSTDHFRDPGNYYLTIFGKPGENTVWGWRFQGHHISFTFCAEQNAVMTATPGFLGSNPGVITDGEEKGSMILKDETDNAYQLINSLSRDQSKKAVFDTAALPEIISLDHRVAAVNNRQGIHYTDLNAKQQHQLLELISVYVHRYTKLFADDMLRDIHAAGLNNLVFAWAGSTKQGPGHPNYYRIVGPTLVIEFDNTQNNGNHFHTVVRDLKNDFGGDELLEHYKQSH